MTIKITKQLATMEDLAIGTGTVVQERNGVQLILNKINISSITSNIASMQTIPAVVGSTINTLGYYSLGDGGGADYIVEAGDTSNGFDRLLMVDNKTAVLVLVNGQMILKQLGALEDGATDDTSVFNAAAASSRANSVLITDRIVLAGAVCPAEVNIYGVQLGVSEVVHQTSTNQDCIIVSPPVGSFKVFEASGFTVTCVGAGRSAIRLPNDSTAFSKAFEIDININIRLASGTDLGYTEGLRIGDCVKGNLRGEYRGGYLPQNADSGQFNSVGVTMDAARGCIGVEFNCMMVNLRRSINIIDNIENFYLGNTELVNTWIGVDMTDSTASKPGGYFGPGLHINSNYRGILFNKRRDFNMLGVQLYRNSTYFDHGTGWIGIEGLAPRNFSITNCNHRNSMAGAGDIGVKMDNASNFNIESQAFGNVTGFETAFSLISCDGFTLSGFSLAAGFDNWVILRSCSNFSVGEHASKDETIGEVYSVIDEVTGTGGTINRSGAAKNKYSQVILGSATTIYETINNQLVDKKISLTSGTAPYVVDVIMPTIGILKGDVLMYFVSIATSSSNPTINFKDGTSARYSITGAGTPQDYTVRLVNNGAGWVEGGLSLS